MPFAYHPGMAETGQIVAIHIRPTSESPASAVDRATLVAGFGLVGDRYHSGDQQLEDPNTAVTLISREALAGLAVDTGIELSAADSRRQILTSGIDLNALVGRRFTVDGVLCEGVELCEPCEHLQSVTQPGVLRGLVHRGGLRAAVLSDGEIAVGGVVASQ